MGHQLFWVQTGGTIIWTLLAGHTSKLAYGFHYPPTITKSRTRGPLVPFLLRGALVDGDSPGHLKLLPFTFDLGVVLARVMSSTGTRV